MMDTSVFGTLRERHPVPWGWVKDADNTWAIVDAKRAVIAWHVEPLVAEAILYAVNEQERFLV